MKQKSEEESVNTVKEVGMAKGFKVSSSKVMVIGDGGVTADCLANLDKISKS